MVKLLKPGPLPQGMIDERTRGMVEWEGQLEVEFELWANELMAWARDCGAVVSEVGIDYRLSLDRLRASLVSGKSGAGKHGRLLDKFRDFSLRCGGYLASLSPAGDELWLSKPSSRWSAQDIGADG